MIGDNKLIEGAAGRAVAPVPTVLVADDDPDLLALMTRRLMKAGYSVVTAVDGQQAIEFATELLPDLALLDVMMPKLTGLEVTARLRADPTTKAMKVILISAGFKKENDEASLTGADSYIVKPFDRDEPLARIRAVLER